MKIPSFTFKKHTQGKRSRQAFTIERLFLQHAVTFFIASTGVLLVLFLVFFYVFFYRAVTGAEGTASDTIHDTQKTVNLGAYGHAVKENSIKAENGKDFASGSKTIPNPFADR